MIRIRVDLTRLFIVCGIGMLGYCISGGYPSLANETSKMLSSLSSDTENDFNHILGNDAAQNMKPDDRRNLPIQLQPTNSLVYEVVTQKTVLQNLLCESQIAITGNTVFKADEILDKIRDNLSSNCKTPDILSEINKLYRENGYPLAFADEARGESSSNDRQQDNTLTIKITEGSIENVEVSGTERLSPEYIRERVKLGIRNPFNSDQLETQLRLLKSANPVIADIRASRRDLPESDGKANILVEVVESSPKFSVQVDNYFPPSVGAERVSAAVIYPNVSGIGDIFSASYSTAFSGGVNLYDFSYQIPLNSLDSTLQMRLSLGNNRITDPRFATFGIRGRSEGYEVVYRNPVIKTIRAESFEEVALSLGFGYQSGQTFLFNDTPVPFGIGPDQDGFSRTSIIKFGQDYVQQDRYGSWQATSTFNLGINLLGSTLNERPTPDGRFFSWLFQLQRVQQLGNNFQLIFQGALQLSPDNLLASNQFVIGGFGSVRGYRQSARYGDNGYRLSVEGRIPVVNDLDGKPSLQLAPFIEAGAVWNQVNNPNILPDQSFLTSAGFGVIMQPIPNLNIRLDYGIPLINLRDRGNNIQESGFYFNAKYQF